MSNIVTKNNENGQAILLSKDEVSVTAQAADYGGAIFWSTAAVPADNSDRDAEGNKRDVGPTLRSGSVFRITEFGPGFTSPMHRTLTIDYGMILSGEIDLILDGGETIRLVAGDTLIQRGTNHIWHNPSPDTTCRYLVCMVESQPVIIDGKPLAQTL